MFSQPTVYLKEYVQLLDLLCWRDVTACDSVSDHFLLRLLQVKMGGAD